MSNPKVAENSLTGQEGDFAALDIQVVHDTAHELQVEYGA